MVTHRDLYNAHPATVLCRQLLPPPGQFLTQFVPARRQILYPPLGDVEEVFQGFRTDNTFDRRISGRLSSSTIGRRATSNDGIHKRPFEPTARYLTSPSQSPSLRTIRPIHTTTTTTAPTVSGSDEGDPAARFQGTAFHTPSTRVTGGDTAHVCALNAYRRASPGHRSLSLLQTMTTHLSYTYSLVGDAVLDPSLVWKEQPFLPLSRYLTSDHTAVGNRGYDNKDTEYILVAEEVIHSDRTRYLVLDLLGKGTFGQAVKCQDLSTRELVTVKILKSGPSFAQSEQNEIEALQRLNNRYDRHDRHHILRFKCSFMHKGHVCMIFEYLAQSLFDRLQQNHYRGFPLRLVRIYAAQLLDALVILKRARIIHADIKPENILLKRQGSDQLKLIDFGAARTEDSDHRLDYVQTRYYRAPEVMLGNRCSTAIDMWSFGCVIAELFFGFPIFPGNNEYDILKLIFKLLGPPPIAMLEDGFSSHRFFECRRQHASSRQSNWFFKYREEYLRGRSADAYKPAKDFFRGKTLGEYVQSKRPIADATRMCSEEEEEHARANFLSFLRGVLQISPESRWTPQQALVHPFITELEVPVMAPSTAYSLSSRAPTPYGPIAPGADLATARARGLTQVSQLHSAETQLSILGSDDPRGEPSSSGQQRSTRTAQSPERHIVQLGRDAEGLPEAGYGPHLKSQNESDSAGASFHEFHALRPSYQAYRTLPGWAGERTAVVAEARPVVARQAKSEGGYDTMALRDHQYQSRSEGIVTTAVSPVGSEHGSEASVSPHNRRDSGSASPDDTPRGPLSSLARRIARWRAKRAR